MNKTTKGQETHTQRDREAKRQRQECIGQGERGGNGEAMRAAKPDGERPTCMDKKRRQNKQKARETDKQPKVVRGERR